MERKTHKIAVVLLMDAEGVDARDAENGALMALMHNLAGGMTGQTGYAAIDYFDHIEKTKGKRGRWFRVGFRRPKDDVPFIAEITDVTTLQHAVATGLLRIEAKA